MHQVAENSVEKADLKRKKERKKERKCFLCSSRDKKPYI